VRAENKGTANLLISMNIAFTSACFLAVPSTRALRAARCSRYLRHGVRKQKPVLLIRDGGVHSIFASFSLASRKLTCTLSTHVTLENTRMQ
jgi:hypothetical protein